MCVYSSRSKGCSTCEEPIYCTVEGEEGSDEYILLYFRRDTNSNLLQRVSLGEIDSSPTHDAYYRNVTSETAYIPDFHTKIRERRLRQSSSEAVNGE